MANRYHPRLQMGKQKPQKGEIVKLRFTELIYYNVTVTCNITML